MSLNPYQPTDVNEAPVATESDYTRLKRTIAGVCILHAVWLAVVLASIGPRLIERNAFAIGWELLAIMLGGLIALRMRPVRTWRIALPVWIVFALYLPVAVTPSWPNGVWRPYMMLAVVVAVATVLLPILERVRYTVFHRD